LEELELTGTASLDDSKELLWSEANVQLS